VYLSDRALLFVRSVERLHPIVSPPAARLAAFQRITPFSDRAPNALPNGRPRQRIQHVQQGHVARFVFVGQLGVRPGVHALYNGEHILHLVVVENVDGSLAPQHWVRSMEPKARLFRRVKL